MSGLSPSELAEFREIFDLVDKDHGGSISSTELAELMSTLGINASQEEIRAMVAEIDADGNGDIDFDEFVAVMSRKVNADYTSKDVKRAFRTFSLGQPNGYVSLESVREALMNHGTVKLNEEQVEELLAQLESDSNGLFNYNEYVDMMMR
jgi:calmodulin|tara:strand:- start:695 stop:1144 length:450 start_codon:yes stop_codon:yes gene_type:complete